MGCPHTRVTREEEMPACVLPALGMWEGEEPPEDTVHILRKADGRSRPLKPQLSFRISHKVAILLFKGIMNASIVPATFMKAVCCVWLSTH